MTKGDTLEIKALLVGQIFIKPYLNKILIHSKKKTKETVLRVQPINNGVIIIGGGAIVLEAKVPMPKGELRL